MKLVVPSVAIALFASACGETPVAPRAERPIGTVSFAYSGVVSGSFSVQAEAPSFDDHDSWSNRLAYAVIEPVSPGPSPRTRVNSSSGSKETSYDNVELHIPLSAPGTTTTTEDCFVPGTLKCAYGGFGFSIPSGTGRPTYHCVIKNGTFTIANKTTTRVAGTFSGSADCLRLEDFQKSSVEITGGVFDVPIIERPTS